jgi:hypothetical protein
VRSLEVAKQKTLLGLHVLLQLHFLTTFIHYMATSSKSFWV